MLTCRIQNCNESTNYLKCDLSNDSSISWSHTRHISIRPTWWYKSYSKIWLAKVVFKHVLITTICRCRFANCTSFAIGSSHESRQISPSKSKYLCICWIVPEISSCAEFSFNGLHFGCHHSQDWPFPEGLSCVEHTS